MKHMTTLPAKELKEVAHNICDIENFKRFPKDLRAEFQARIDLIRLAIESEKETAKVSPKITKPIPTRPAHVKPRVAQPKVAQPTPVSIKDFETSVSPNVSCIDVGKLMNAFGI